MYLIIYIYIFISIYWIVQYLLFILIMLYSVNVCIELFIYIYWNIFVYFQGFYYILNVVSEFWSPADDDINMSLYISRQCWLWREIIVQLVSSFILNMLLKYNKKCSSSNTQEPYHFMLTLFVNNKCQSVHFSDKTTQDDLKSHFSHYWFSCFCNRSHPILYHHNAVCGTQLLWIPL